mmetsp:Transcript_38158/g.75677  ORF Transcript_38158/g.75677 Transcript_38158/m.75677 type:complete len:147 (+) Transcript_38158:570-1010(+)
MFDFPLIFGDQKSLENETYEVKWPSVRRLTECLAPETDFVELTFPNVFRFVFCAHVLYAIPGDAQNKKGQSCGIEKKRPRLCDALSNARNSPHCSSTALRHEMSKHSQQKAAGAPNHHVLSPRIKCEPPITQLLLRLIHDSVEIIP